MLQNFQYNSSQFLFTIMHDTKENGLIQLARLFLGLHKYVHNGNGKYRLPLRETFSLISFAPYEIIAHPRIRGYYMKYI